MTAPIAFIFPGQGSQSVGMGSDLRSDAACAAMLDEAAEILGYDLHAIMVNGPEDQLRQTLHTQPSLYVHSACLTVALRARGAEPVAVAGHSLGEYSALHAAGVFSFADGLRLVKVRAELMQNAGAIAPGTMAAVMGLGDDAVAEVCAESSGQVVAANFNAPGQTVISGAREAVEKAADALKARGAKRVVPLPVAGAFHSPLMEPAARELAVAIAAADFADPRVPVAANADGALHTSAPELRDLLVRQMTSSVRWTESVRALRAHGIVRFAETGNGKVLTNLVKRIDGDAQTVSCASLAELDAVISFAA